jgi:hypothetical protein
MRGIDEALAEATARPGVESLPAALAKAEQIRAAAVVPSQKTTARSKA